MWVILQNNADWDCFKTPVLQQILRIQDPLLEEHCAFLEVIRLFQLSSMCKKQTSVAHSSTESEIISLDTGLRLDRLLALELSDLIVFVFGSVSHVSDRSGQPDNDVKRNHESQGKINVMENIDFFPSYVQSSHQEVLLHVFGGNEAVIKNDHERK